MLLRCKRITVSTRCRFHSFQLIPLFSLLQIEYGADFTVRASKESQGRNPPQKRLKTTNADDSHAARHTAGKRVGPHAGNSCEGRSCYRRKHPDRELSYEQHPYGCSTAGSCIPPNPPAFSTGRRRRPRVQPGNDECTTRWKIRLQNAETRSRRSRAGLASG